MHISEEAVIAKCYIQEQNNEDNICYLSPDNLFVKSKGILSYFPLDSIMNISFKNKIFLMPIIFGGIIGSLSLIALFNSYYNVWLMLSLMMGGFALLYYGVEGSQALIVQTNVKEYDFFIRAASPNLKSFVTFVINYQHRGEDALIHYFLVEDDIFNKAKISGYLDLTSPVRLSPQKPVRTGNKTLLSVNISQISSEIEYLMDSKENRLLPSLDGRISIEHIIIPNE